jgi:hypothetical protein
LERVVKRRGITWRTAVAAGLVTLFIGLTGEADHAWKNHRSRHADVDTWYCDYRHERCDKPQTPAIEESWEHREAVYKGLFGVSAYGSLAFVAVAAGSRRRRT